MLVLRDQRFVLEGNQPGYLKWWYRVDQSSDVKCWNSVDASCYYVQDTGAQANGSFSHYWTEEPEQLIALHKWFAYGEMLMRTWAPVRIVLDDLWHVAGMSGYRPVNVLDEDLDDYLYARTGLEPQMVGDQVDPDVLATVLDLLRPHTSSATEEEWNFLAGRGLQTGAGFLYAFGISYLYDWLRSDLPSGSEMAKVVGQSETVADAANYYRGQATAKFIAISM